MASEICDANCKQKQNESANVQRSTSFITGLTRLTSMFNEAKSCNTSVKPPYQPTITHYLSFPTMKKGASFQMFCLECNMGHWGPLWR